MKFTVEETNLMCIYGTQSRQGLIDELVEMQTHLQSDEAELMELANAVIAKLKAMSDKDFAAIASELIADFE
ncbi:MAG: transposon-transfer assisting family protein [Clostridiales bacterium]|jgi:hypothetical protein|nr:transposon-transfer assisting family protein [Clostridiales bacterium]